MDVKSARHLILAPSRIRIDCMKANGTGTFLSWKRPPVGSCWMHLAITFPGLPACVWSFLEYSDSIPRNRIWQERQNLSLWIYLQRRDDFTRLWALSDICCLLAACLLWWSQLPHWELPMERLKWQATEGGLQPAAQEELNPANRHVTELGNCSFPSRETWDACNTDKLFRCHVWVSPEPEDPAQLHLNSRITDAVRKHRVSYKAWVRCFTQL